MAVTGSPSLAMGNAKLPTPEKDRELGGPAALTVEGPLK